MSFITCDEEDEGKFPKKNGHFAVFNIATALRYELGNLFNKSDIVRAHCYQNQVFVFFHDASRKKPQANTDVRELLVANSLSNLSSLGYAGQKDPMRVALLQETLRSGGEHFLEQFCYDRMPLDKALERLRRLHQISRAIRPAQKTARPWEPDQPAGLPEKRHTAPRFRSGI